MSETKCVIFSESQYSATSQKFNKNFTKINLTSEISDNRENFLALVCIGRRAPNRFNLLSIWYLTERSNTQRSTIGSFGCLWECIWMFNTIDLISDKMFTQLSFRLWISYSKNVCFDEESTLWVTKHSLTPNDWRILSLLNKYFNYFYINFESNNNLV